MVYIFIIFLRGCGFEIGVGYKVGGSYLTKQGKLHRVQKKQTWTKLIKGVFNISLWNQQPLHRAILSLPLDGHVLVLAIGFGVFIVLIKFNVI
jgi:hypothetical protein